MKRILLYTAIAIVLGLVITLVPLIAATEITVENSYVRFLGLAGESAVFSYGSKTQEYSAGDVEIFAVSFVIAIAIYAVAKRRMPREGHLWIKTY
ncbi:MAG: hypothetical protein OEY22_11235 [Candidatus Bathyarchaeota archaeon]|nr:hypothetical protein [Candidatus Bathyarchaeota archaeon]MDH5787577.1 hypothetical protein [Candidatus Bathyarchaeota archaeon]